MQSAILCCLQHTHSPELIRMGVALASKEALAYTDFAYFLALTSVPPSMRA